MLFCMYLWFVGGGLLTHRAPANDDECVSCVSPSTPGGGYRISNWMFSWRRVGSKWLPEWPRIRSRVYSGLDRWMRFVLLLVKSPWLESTLTPFDVDVWTCFSVCVFLCIFVLCMNSLPRIWREVGLRWNVVYWGLKNAFDDTKQNLPEHSYPSPWKPERQVHVYLVLRLRHVALVWHAWPFEQ